MQQLPLLPGFRSERELAINEVFFRDNKEKNVILRGLWEGYRSNWDERLQPPWEDVSNFKRLSQNVGNDWKVKQNWENGGRFR